MMHVYWHDFKEKSVLILAQVISLSIIKNFTDTFIEDFILKSVYVPHGHPGCSHSLEPVPKVRRWKDERQKH